MSDQEQGIEVRIKHHIEGARNAKGLCVIIDVFRACTVLCFVAVQNPEKIIVSNDLDQIKKLSRIKNSPLTIGKNHAPGEPIFDMPNSPSVITQNNISNRIVILNSEGGINGLVEAQKAEEVISGSFVNAKAVSNYILETCPEIVTLVCMGHLGKQFAIEDALCAEYIKSLILKGNFDVKACISQILQAYGAEFLINANRLSESDYQMCLDFDKFDFILKRQMNEHIFSMERINT